MIEQVAAAYREGSGVPYARYGEIFRRGQASVNRPAFVNDLVPIWLNAVPDVAARLREGGRVADLGCGAGWSTIALAQGLTRAEVIGHDSDRGSIEDAVSNAREAGLNPVFKHADATELAADGPFDLILLLEALHNLAHPAEALGAARRALAPGGAVLVADEKVGEVFTAPADELERLMFGWSVTHCLPASMTEKGSAAIGTVIRPDTIRQLALASGFGSVEVSDIDAGFFRLYVLREAT